MVDASPFIFRDLWPDWRRRFSTQIFTEVRTEFNGGRFHRFRPLGSGARWPHVSAERCANLAETLCEAPACPAGGTDAEARGDSGPTANWPERTLMRPPAFWHTGDWPSRLLAPLSAVGAAITARRVARPGWTAPVPVICCGNATVGGAGKTTLALDLAHRLTARGIAVHILLRGYRGSARGPRQVLPSDDPTVTGDEALLLAATAPTWTGADRAASARAAIAAGAEALIMDDGLQNPSLDKTMSLLVVDGATGFGNGRVLPAGPLREPVAAAAARCRAAVMIGSDTSGAARILPPSMPVLRASLVQGPEILALSGRRAVAFTGIAIPEKFFGALDRAGVIVAERRAFPDHHFFTASELNSLENLAKGAILVTTPKDAVRLPPAFRAKVMVVPVRLDWDDGNEIEALLDEALLRRAA